MAQTKSSHVSLYLFLAVAVLALAVYFTQTTTPTSSIVPTQSPEAAVSTQQPTAQHVMPVYPERQVRADVNIDTQPKRPHPDNKYKDLSYAEKRELLKLDVQDIYVPMRDPHTYEELAAQIEKQRLQDKEKMEHIYKYGG